MKDDCDGEFRVEAVALYSGQPSTKQAAVVAQVGEGAGVARAAADGAARAMGTGVMRAMGTGVHRAIGAGAGAVRGHANARRRSVTADVRELIEATASVFAPAEATTRAQVLDINALAAVKPADSAPAAIRALILATADVFASADARDLAIAVTSAAADAGATATVPATDANSDSDQRAESLHAAWDADERDAEIPEVSRKLKPRVRTKRTRMRSRTIAMKRLTRAELLRGAVANPPVEGIERPMTRAECSGAARPCPWVACKHHLYLDINPRTGSIKINFPDLEPWELQHTCALDVADNGGLTLEEIGLITNLTRERVRQVEVRGLLTLKSRSSSLK